MNLDFVRVTIEGFKTFVGDPQTLLLAGKVPGLQFIQAFNEDEPNLESNGSGKSSIFDAVSWCLYGCTVDGRRTPDIIPWSGDTNPKVSVVVNVDGRRRNVTRVVKPNKLLIDDKEVGQDEVERLVGISFEVFKQTVILGQGEDLFFDLSPKDKMEVFTSALNLTRWEDRADVASTEVRALENELINLRAENSAKQEHLKQAKLTLERSQERAGEWDATRKSQRAELKEQLVSLEKRLPTLRTNRDEASMAADAAGVELVAIEKKMTPLIKAKSAASAAYELADERLNAVENDIQALTRELGVKADTCPQCGQSLKGTSLAKHKASLQAKILALQAQLDVGIPKELANAVAATAAALKKATTEADAYRAKAHKAQTSLNVAGPELARVQTEIASIQRTLENYDEEVNPHREQTQATKKQIGKLEADVESIQLDIADAEKEQLRTAFWVKGFKQIRLRLLDELLQELELATNALLPESGLIDWEVHYNVEKETKKGTVISGLNVQILSPNNKKPVKWECWSGGERHRLRVVGSLALAEVLLSHAGVNTNLEVLDEPTHDLSVRGVQDLCEFLAARANKLDKDIFITGHNIIKGVNFSKTVTVIKRKGGVSVIDPEE